MEEYDVGDAVIVSAGVAANNGDPATAEAIETMKSYGIDLSHHRSRHIDGLDLPRVDLFITMSDSHATILEGEGVDRKKIVVAAQEQGGIPDPYGGSLADYEQTAKVLDEVARSFAQTAKDAGGTRRHTR